MISQTRNDPPPRKKIMLVEDDAGVRRSLQLLLQARGFDVRAYATGEALLRDLTAREAIGLVADYQMAGLDGLDVLDRLRAEGWGGRALLITAFPSDALARRAAALGYDSVLEKPFRESALADAMSAMLRRVPS